MAALIKGIFITALLQLLYALQSPLPNELCPYPAFPNSNDIRPVISSTENGTCFWVFKEGPCTPVNWFKFKNDDGSKNHTQKDVCHQRACPPSLEDDRASNFFSFWRWYNGECRLVLAKNSTTCSDSDQWPRFGVDENCRETLPSGRDFLDSPLLSWLKILRGF